MDNLNSTTGNELSTASDRVPLTGAPKGGKVIKKCYLFALLMTISLGTIQFGYSIGSWNTANDPYSKIVGWTEEEKTKYQTLAQSLTTAGSAVGALFSGPLMKYGRWKCILLTNFFVVVGAGVTLIYNLPMLMIGRTFYGIACGCYSVFCPKFISETAPTEVKGPAGALSQICITFGILVPFMIGLIFGETDDDSKNRLQIWIIFLIPIALAILQVLLMILVFPYDTPPMLSQKRQSDQLSKFMSNLYYSDYIQPRIEELRGGDQQRDSMQDKETDVSYGQVCCGPQYSKATMVGSVMAVFQQLTGINFIMFYSNTLFANSGMPTQAITGLVGVVNFLTTFGGLFLLTVAGRRTIMVSCSIIMSAILLVNGWSDLEGYDTLAIVTTMLFIAFFEFSSGPITWLYMAEIMQDKAVGIATVLNWIINLIISLITPSLIKAIGDENVGWIFIVMGGFTVVGTIFIMIFMKETRGKTAAEIQQMFSK